jgi:putative ATP-dependent endonuclease of OLD family
LEDEDFHCKDVTQPITVTVMFTDLSPEAQADFGGYYRQGKLVITAKAEWNPATRRAEVKQ